MQSNIFNAIDKLAEYDSGKLEREYSRVYRTKPISTPMIDPKKHKREIEIKEEKPTKQISIPMPEAVMPKKKLSIAIDLYYKYAKEYLEGGDAENMEDEDFSKKQLDAGKKIEMEHTNDKNIANEIAKDHLVIDPVYYEPHLKDMLKSVHKDIKENIDEETKDEGLED